MYITKEKKIVISKEQDGAFVISPDGRYFFFNSNKREEQTDSYWLKLLSYDEVLEKLDTLYNGYPNIYWVSAIIIEELKTKALLKEQ